MARNIEIPGTGKFVKVQKYGKNTLLTLGDKHHREAAAESRAFLVLMPTSVPIIMMLSVFPHMAELVSTAGASPSPFLTAIASIPSYVNIVATLLAIVMILAFSFKLVKMFSNTEPSNTNLSLENIAKIGEEKSQKRTIVQGNLTKCSAEYIIQSFISQAYPEMIIESKDIEYDYVPDTTFSKIFNSVAA